MGIKRGAYATATLGNITAPTNIAANVPTMDVGVGMRAAAKAKESDAEHYSATYNFIAQQFFNAAMDVGAYQKIKDSQKQNMIRNEKALMDYNTEVDSYQREFVPAEHAQLEKQYKDSKATYDSWGIWDVEAKDAAADAAGEAAAGASESSGWFSGFGDWFNFGW